MPSVNEVLDWVVKRISAVTRTATDADLTDSEYMAVDNASAYTRKITVASLATWIHKKWAAFVNAITAKTSFVGGDKIPVVNGDSVSPMEADKLLELTSQNVLGKGEVRQLEVINDSLPVITKESAVAITNQYINASTHEPTNSLSWSCYKFVGKRFNRIRVHLYAYNGISYEVIACYSSETTFNATTYLGGLIKDEAGPFDAEFYAPEGTKCILVANRDATGMEDVSIEISIAEIKETFNAFETEIAASQKLGSDNKDWGALDISTALNTYNGYFDNNVAFVESSSWRTYVFDAQCVSGIKAKVISNSTSIKAIVFLSNTDLSHPQVLSSVKFGTAYEQVVLQADAPAGCQRICVCNRYASLPDAFVWVYLNSLFNAVPSLKNLDETLTELDSRLDEEESSVTNFMKFTSKSFDSVLSTSSVLFNGSEFQSSSSWTSYVFDANGIKNVFARLITNSTSYGAIVFLRNRDISNPDIISYVAFSEAYEYESISAVVPNGCKAVVLCNRTASGGTPDAYLQAASVYDAGYSAFCGVLNFGGTDYDVQFGDVEGVASHFKMAMVKDGEVKYFLDQTNINKDINGNFDSVLDGTDGDMLIVNDVPIYTISCQGKNYSMRLFSLAPFTYDGMPCRKIECRGDAPSYCFVDNINEDEHLDQHETMLGSGKSHFVRNADNVAYYAPMHNLVGKYVPTEIGGVISYSYDADKEFRVNGGKYLPTVFLTQNTAENAATNKNTGDVVYTNKDVISLDNVLGLVEAEAKTNYINSDDLFGNGFCSAQTTAPSESLFTNGTKAINGVRFKDSSDNWVYCLLKDKPFNDETEYLFAMLTDWNSPWEIMEQHLVLSYVKTNNIPVNTWFVYNENEYKYINAGSLKGLADGVMTAVLFKKFRTKLASGVTYRGNSVAGNDIEFVIISSVYRGWILDVSPHIWITGYNLVCDDSNNYKAYLCFDWRKYLMNRNYTEIGENEVYDFEKVYTKYGAFSSVDAYVYIKRCSEFSLSVLAEIGSSDGFVRDQCGTIETDSKVASEGKKIVTGVKLGYGAWSFRLSRNHIYCWHPRTYVVAKAGYSAFVCQNVIV